MKKRRGHRHLKPWVYVFMVVMLINILLWIVMIPPTVHAEQEHEVQQVCQTLYVYAGDTLWEMAKKIAPPNMDLRKYIQIVLSVNNLQNSDIYTGQKLLFPLYP